MDKKMFTSMISEDNTMLAEENEILRSKISGIKTFVESQFLSDSLIYEVNKNIGADYWMGRRSVLQQLNKMI